MKVTKHLEARDRRYSAYQNNEWQLTLLYHLLPEDMVGELRYLNDWKQVIISLQRGSYQIPAFQKTFRD